jgi:uncharacterized protein with GYD domain
MATYISLLRYTQQGMTALKQAPTRIDAARETYKALGADLKALYLVMGPETLRAFSEDEFRKIVAELP